MSNPNALYLLADHIKLSLLERQRSKALNLLQDDDTDAAAAANAEAGSAAASERDTQDGHIARSLDQLEEGITSLKREQERLESEGEENKALNIGDALPGLQKKLDELTAQFNGKAPISSAGTSSSIKPRRSTPLSTAKKGVRFQDKPLPPPGTDGDDVDLEAQRNNLFNRPYTDDPDVDGSSSQEDSGAGRYGDHDNVQLHQMHSRIIADQDAQLDALGLSIGRQRELSMQIGDELDSHVAMLEEGERLTDQHQTRIDRARRQVGKIARSAGDCKQMVAIVVLIIILILLIAILK
ncbi:hypothetical protein Sste5346_003779 [Sporothrix stenoceras]|uniref:t-SNARE coiled-coil homology domain-containing protein n=1 Tax=Sporothrix stenoceras TaxID=5173 RepID=A0ABR3ZCQ0_9PEZI